LGNGSLLQALLHHTVAASWRHTWRQIKEKEMPVILYTLLLAAVFPIVVSALALRLRRRQFGKIDNDHPRQQQAQLSGVGARLVAAQQNAWEALAVYTAVIVIAHAAGVDLHQLALPAVLFIAFRVVFTVLYAINYSTLRSLAFAGGMFCCLYIVYVAATYG